MYNATNRLQNEQNYQPFYSKNINTEYCLENSKFNPTKKKGNKFLTNLEKRYSNY
jgi:hypothetical protein